MLIQARIIIDKTLTDEQICENYLDEIFPLDYKKHGKNYVENDIVHQAFLITMNLQREYAKTHFMAGLSRNILRITKTDV